jgi:hypothetical protein
MNHKEKVERAVGKEFAKLLVEHTDRMEANGVKIPVEHKGVKYWVKVEKVKK